MALDSKAIARAEIAKVYVAAFGRVPDAGGLTNWLNQYEAGLMTYSQIADAFTTSVEYTNKYPAILTNAELVTKLYLNVFGRTVDSSGLANWTAQLDNPEVSGINRTNVLDKLLTTAKGDGTNTDGMRLENIAKFSVQSILDGVPEATATAQIANITSDAATVTTATAAVSGSMQAGSTYTLKTSVDNFAGTDANDTYAGVLTTSIAAGSTLNSGDTIDAGAGIDTLNITIADIDATAPVATLTNVEKVIATVADASGAPSAINASNWTGVTTVGVKNTTTTHATNNGFTLSSLQNNVTLTLDNVTVGTDNDLVLDASFASGKVGSSTATLAIETSAVGSKTKDGLVKVTDAGSDLFTGLSVAATGANYITLDMAGTSTTSLDSLTVTGTGSVKLTDQAAELDGIKTVSGSTNTGGITVDLQNNVTENMSITTGSGADSLTFAIAKNATVNSGAGDDVITLQGTVSTATLTTDDSIDGGDGTDILAMEDAEWDALDGDATNDRATLKNFEIARVTDTLATEINVSKITGIKDVQLTTATASDAAKISGLASGATIEVRAVADSTEEVELSVTGATNASTPDDALTLKLNADLTANAITQTSFAVEGVNKITVTTADRDNSDAATDKTEGYSLDFEATKAANVDTITVTGDRAFYHYVDSDTDALATVNAAGNAGQVVVSFASFNGTQGATITGGSKENTLYGTSLADTITGGADGDILQGAGGKDTLSGGADVDYLDGGAAADSMTGGDGADYFYVNNNATSAGLETITDFAAGTDKIVYGGTAFGGSVVEVTTSLEDKATLAAAATTAGSTIGANNAGTFTYKSDKYILIDANATTGFTDGTDVILKVTNMTGTLAASDFATTGITLAGTELSETFVGTVGNDTITGGDGADTINISSGGLDTIVYSALTDGGTAGTNGGNDSITGFVSAGAAGDSIDIDGLAQTAFDDITVNSTIAWASLADGNTGAAEAVNVTTTAEAIFVAKAQQTGVGTSLTNASDLANLTKVAAMLEAQVTLTAATGNDALVVIESDVAGTFGVYSYVETGGTANQFDVADLAVLGIVTADAVAVTDFTMS